MTSEAARFPRCCVLSIEQNEILILLGFGIAESEAIADPILNRLAHVPQFAFGGVGYAGAISQGQKDCKSVLARFDGVGRPRKASVHR